MRTTLGHPRRRSRRYGVLVAVATLALLAASCGDDDDDDAATTTTAETGDLAAFCDAYAEVAVATAGPPDPTVDVETLVGQLQDNAPPDIAADVSEFVAALQEMGGEEGPPEEDAETDATDDQGGAGETSADGTEGEGEGGGAPPEDFLTSSAAVGRYAAENCAEDRIEVTAIEYEYEGIPETLTAGQYGWLLDNEGEEWHEIILVKKNEGVTQSFDELLELPDDEALEFVQVIGQVFAGPGATSGTVADLTPGEYLAVCFIPVGTTGLDVESDGPPHFTEGMLHEFTVNAS
jgi:hypothetical protein